MVIYEWEDAKYLGKVTDPADDYLPVSKYISRTSHAFSDILLPSRKRTSVQLAP